MKVRDGMFKKTEYKGRETDAAHEDCPCMPCYNAHDCGGYKTIYTTDPATGRVRQRAEWNVEMRCATRENGGCPHPRGTPEHIYTARGRKCKRCGQFKT